MISQNPGAVEGPVAGKNRGNSVRIVWNFEGETQDDVLDVFAAVGGTEVGFVHGQELFEAAGWFAENFGEPVGFAVWQVVAVGTSIALLLLAVDART